MSNSDDQLKQLYPFLYRKESGSAAKPAPVNAAHPDPVARKHEDQQARLLVASVREKADHSVAVKQRFFQHNAHALVRAAGAIGAVYRRQGRLFTMGNGGSSCDAAHLAVEFQHPVTTGRPALAAWNLVADNAMLTAVGNDVGMAHVFARQLEAHARPGDGLIGFSTSGNSGNLLKAFAKARDMNLVTLGLSGGDGGEMKSSGLVDHCLVVESDSIHRVQEVHVAAYHILWDLVHTLLADDRGNLAGPEAGDRQP